MPRLRTLGPSVAILDARIARPLPKEADAGYLTPEHRAWAAAVIARDSGRCQWPGCAKAAPSHRMVADHIRELKDGGARYDVANGQCLCVRHNTLKGLRARQARLSRPVEGEGGGGV